jgi:flagellar basal-body rod modification protein FlgD
MTIDLIGGGTSSVAQSTNMQQAAINQEDFLKILLTQLQFQDPLKPMDNQEFLAQMAQFSTLAQTSQLNERIDTLLSVQSAMQSVGLIGKTVQATINGVTVVGVVGTLQFSNDVTTLTLTTENNESFTDVRVSDITLVR